MQAFISKFDDPELIQPIEDKIANEKVSAPEALDEVNSQFIVNLRIYG